MPRGNNSRGRGRGPPTSPHGNSQDRGRGRGRGRGQGRGQYDDDAPFGGRYPHTGIDHVVQVWQEPPSNFSRGGYRGRTPRLGSGSATPQRGGSTPRRGMSRGRGRGGSDTPRARLGFGDNRNRNARETFRLDVPLSKLLNSERPYLKPVIFVPSVYTKTLFEEVEDLLQPVAESAVTEESHVPTADRVTRVFSGGNFPSLLSSSSEDDRSEEELEELDFADMGKLRDQLDMVQKFTDARVPPVASSPCEEVFTGICNNRNHPSTQNADVITDLISIDTFVGETTATSIHEHNVTSLENSTVTAIISEDNEIVVEKPDTVPVSPSPKVPISDEITASPAGPADDDVPTFFIDTEPTRPSTHRSASDVVLFNRTCNGVPLGEDDELIVYVAPHPRSGRYLPTPDVPRVRLPSRSLLTGTTNPVRDLTGSIAREESLDNKNVPSPPGEAPQFSSVSFDFTPSSVRTQPFHRPAFTSGDRSKMRAQARQRDSRVARKRARRQAVFGSFGAMLSEAKLRDADERERKDLRWESRRQDDSDVDWGDDDEAPENDAVDEVSSGLGGMDLDPDLEPNLEAMKGFVNSMSAEGSRHVTMDDIEDQERMRFEDEEEDDENDSHYDSNDSSDEEDEEENAAFELEEEILVAELQGERPRGPSPSESSDDEENSSDDELSPRGSFQARLHRLREKSRAEQPAAEAAGDEELPDTPFPPWSRANADDDYISRIEDLLEKHSNMPSVKDGKQRSQLFHAIQNGQFDDYDDYVELNGSFSYAEMKPASRKKDKAKDLPAELQAVWEKDRAKKAERKKAREVARLLAAIDPLEPKKGGKKGRKAMRAAADLDPSVLAQVPNAIVDMVSLEQQIRRFMSYIGGKKTMVLPPMDKTSRKQVHELANAFGLKSQSKGKGHGRYTTLMKTNGTSNVNEQKVKKIIKKCNNGFERPHDGKSWTGMPRHKDGDEVGKAAPKIGETNVGFKMLASMGWAEGDRIGGDASTGIDAPLTAIIKNTKLGLGATR